MLACEYLYLSYLFIGGSLKLSIFRVPIEQKLCILRHVLSEMFIYINYIHRHLHSKLNMHINIFIYIYILHRLKENTCPAIFLNIFLYNSIQMSYISPSEFASAWRRPGVQRDINYLSNFIDKWKGDQSPRWRGIKNAHHGCEHSTEKVNLLRKIAFSKNYSTKRILVTSVFKKFLIGILYIYISQI